MNDLDTLEEYKEYLKKKKEELTIEIQALEENVVELDNKISIIKSTLKFIEELEKGYYAKRDS